MSSDNLKEKVLQSILANQIALDFNEAIKHTIKYRHKLKNVLNRAIIELIKSEKEEFDPLFDSKSGEAAASLHTTLAEIVGLIIKIGIKGFGDIGNILQAYIKDSEAFNDLADKINNNKTK